MLPQVRGGVRTDLAFDEYGRDLAQRSIGHERFVHEDGLILPGDNVTIEDGGEFLRCDVRQASGAGHPAGVKTTAAPDLGEAVLSRTLLL
jgi:hypothetical protein